MTRNFFIIVSAALWLVSPAAWSFYEHNYGLGATASGRAGSITSEPDNAYAAIYNPALLASSSRSLFAFSLGTAGASLDSFGLVQTDSPEFRTASGTFSNEDVTLKTEPTTLWTAGISHPFYVPFIRGYRGGWGIAMNGPFQRARQFRAGTPYDFEQLRYGTADSQFKGSLGLAFEVIPESLSIGVGSSMYLTGAGSADATIVGVNPTARLLIDVAFNAAFLGGVHARSGPWHFGANYRESIDPRFTQQFTGRVELGGSEVVRQPMLIQTSLYYEPAAVEFDGSYRGTRFTASLGASVQRWSGFQPSYLVLETQDSDGKTRKPILPSLVLNDTINPRASVAYHASDALTLTSGYQYRPSPIQDLSGPANIVDSDAHIFAASVSYRFAMPEVWPEPMRISVYGQYHRLQSRQVTKSRPDYIGSPGYPVSGYAYCAGLEYLIGL